MCYFFFFSLEQTQTRHQIFGFINNSRKGKNGVSFTPSHCIRARNCAWESKQIFNSFNDLLLMKKKLHSMCTTY